jgi:sulfhydrogenase subunit beta (sulfur reductase)
MTHAAPHPNPMFLPHERLQDLLDALDRAGYLCVGPTLRDGAILYDRLETAADLPTGVTDEQAPGSYRTRVGDGRRRFAWANGPQALKPFLFAPRETLWRATRREDGRLEFRPADNARQPLAVIGARACDLAALDLQDKHFLRAPHPDPGYASRREGLFIVGVHCSHPADTCFCASTGDGPRATLGFDIALSELDDGSVAEAGSERGAAILGGLRLADATPEQIGAGEEQSRRAAAAQQRTLPGRNLQAALFGNLEHPRWNEVAGRCLSCGNCTSVCPTCFCYSEADAPRIDGGSAEHLRQWDSCFTQGHSYIHGFTVRADTRMRYRQWLTHKLGSWHAQYGRSGCVGCGRCIAWCPTGIDITAEAAAICEPTK